MACSSCHLVVLLVLVVIGGTGKRRTCLNLLKRKKKS